VRKKHHTVDRVRFVDQLGMGGLYRRSCIDKVGYFSNPYFFAYEEFDLGVQLSRLGFKLIRIPHKMIDHFGDETSYISTMLNRFKSRYIYGSGQYLRRSINAGHFLQTAWELRIYVFTIIWSTIGMLCFILWFSTPGAFKFYIISTSILFMLVLLIKRNVNKTLFSIISWTMQSIGLIIGFFRSAKDPKSFKPEVIVIK
jgi:GT2 family glycosyltransferase